MSMGFSREEYWNGFPPIRHQTNYTVNFFFLHLKYRQKWDFPGSPVAKTLPSNVEGVGWILGQEAKIPHATWSKNKTEAVLYQIQ